MPVNKVFASCDDAVADVFDGATVMVGGFGSYGGLPCNLIAALAQQGAKNLTVISNMGGRGFELTKEYKPGGYQDLGALYAKCQVKKFIGAVPALGGLPPTSPLEIQLRWGPWWKGYGRAQAASAASIRQREWARRWNGEKRRK